jgi:hypothetical protein
VGTTRSSGTEGDDYLNGVTDVPPGGEFIEGNEGFDTCVNGEMVESCEA